MRWRKKKEKPNQLILGLCWGDPLSGNSPMISHAIVDMNDLEISGGMIVNRKNIKFTLGASLKATHVWVGGIDGVRLTSGALNDPYVTPVSKGDYPFLSSDDPLIFQFPPRALTISIDTV